MNMPQTGPGDFRRITRLAPDVADILRAASLDADRLQRRIESLLGGQEDVRLDTEVIRELVRCYEHLESSRSDSGRA